jgi:hypothetical protein
MCHRTNGFSFSDHVANSIEDGKEDFTEKAFGLAFCL